MSDWPIGLRQGTRYGTLNPFALNQPVGEVSAGASGSTAAAWPAANRALYLPVIVSQATTITKLSVYNGAVAGEVDCGLFSVVPSGGLLLSRLAHSGKVAMSGASVLQVFDIADTAVSPGIYYLGFICSTVTTATFRRSEPGLAAINASGIGQEAPGVTELPESPIPVKAEANYVPILTATTRATY